MFVMFTCNKGDQNETSITEKLDILVLQAAGYFQSPDFIEQEFLVGIHYHTLPGQYSFT